MMSHKKADPPFDVKTNFLFNVQCNCSYLKYFFNCIVKKKGLLSTILKTLMPEKLDKTEVCKIL